MKNKFLKNLLCIIVIFTVILSILVIPASAADESSEDTVLIEAGTYRFNDVLTSHLGYPNCFFDGVFTVKTTLNLPAMPEYGFSGYIGEHTFVCTHIWQEPPGYDGVSYDVISVTPALPASLANLGISLPDSIYFYDGMDKRWETDFYGEGIQYITITEDTYAPADFGLWANANWQKLGDEEVPETCPTLQDYLDEFRDAYEFYEWLLTYDLTFVDSLGMVFNLEWNYASRLESDNPDLYDSIYSSGYTAGESYGYDEGLIIGREEGWQKGYNAGSSSSFGENLIVDLFDAPIQVIDNIVLYENTVAGVTFTVTLWNVLTSVIIICILTWILKLIGG